MFYWALKLIMSKEGRCIRCMQSIGHLDNSVSRSGSAAALLLLLLLLFLLLSMLALRLALRSRSKVAAENFAD